MSHKYLERMKEVNREMEAFQAKETGKVLESFINDSNVKVPVKNDTGGFDDPPRARSILAVKSEQKKQDKFTLDFASSLWKGLSPSAEFKERTDRIKSEVEGIERLIRENPERFTFFKLQASKGRKVTIYKSFEDAENAGFKKSGIDKVLSGNSKTHRGFKWKKVMV